MFIFPCPTSGWPQVRTAAGIDRNEEITSLSCCQSMYSSETYQRNCYAHNHRRFLAFVHRVRTPPENYLQLATMNGRLDSVDAAFM